MFIKPNSEAAVSLRPGRRTRNITCLPGQWERHVLFSRQRTDPPYMQNTFLTLVAAPMMGWLTLLALLVVGYLGRLEYLERRKNRRLEEKRAQLSHGAPLKSNRPLAMRKRVVAAPLNAICPVAGRGFQKFDRQTGWNLRPVDLN